MKINSKITCLFLQMTMLLMVFDVLGQNVAREGKLVKSPINTNKYDRSALTMLLINYPGEIHASQIQAEFLKVDVPSKFDDNTLSVRSINMEGNRSNTMNASNSILNTFNQNKIGNSIIAKWYNRQSDGSLDMKLIEERAHYNAKGMDVAIAGNSKKGLSAIMDIGDKLIANSYILVMDYSGVKTADEYYDANNTASNQRTSHGWIGNYSAYLYKLNYDESIYSVIYDDLWLNKEDNDKTKAERSARFESSIFPVSYLESVSGPLNAMQLKPQKGDYAILSMFTVQKSDDELFSEMVAKGVEKAEYDIAKTLEAFQVKTTVISANPITAKIGKKEGLKVDDRYFIYEKVQKHNGDIKEVKRGVVRATNKIIDNRAMATGHSTDVSKFYQIGGNRVEEGMLLKQKNDKGIGIFVNYSSGNIGGYGIGLEYMINKLVHGFPPSLKLFAEFATDKKTYDYTDVNFTRYNIGISKSFYFGRKFQLEPSFAYGKEETSDGASDNNTYGAYFLKPGIKLGINLRHNIQIMVGVNYYSFLTGVSGSDGESHYDQVKWTELYPEREGISTDVGLRLQF